MAARSISLALLLSATLLTGCAVAGPAAVSNGRSIYNNVINRTEDEQILSMIVHQRYDETFGMLAVSSVTASLKIGAKVGANAGVGPSQNYAGNLVPLSAEAAYEENPTISYVPLRGEAFVEKMLAPISADQTLLLGRMSTAEIEVLTFLVRRANGLVNPLYSSVPAGGDFDRFIELFASLREAGKLDVVRTGDGQFELLLHDWSDDESRAAREMLKMLNVDRSVENGKQLAVPLRFFVGARQPGGIDLETPSALEVIEAAARGVDVPRPHLEAGVARPRSSPVRHELFAIHSSLNRPAFASIAVQHKGWWFYIDERDPRSKQGFMILRTLIGLRLNAATPTQSAPVLTVPVAR